MYIIISIYILYLYYLSILKLSLNTVFVMKKENVWTRTQNDASSKKIPRRTQRSRRGQCWWQLWLSLPERRFSRSATRISPPPIFVHFLPCSKILILRSCRNQFQKDYPTRNFTLSIFSLYDRFNIPNGSRDMGVPNWLFSLLHHDIQHIQQL